jgi:hypothetical protein
VVSVLAGAVVLVVDVVFETVVEVEFPFLLTVVFVVLVVLAAPPQPKETTAKQSAAAIAIKLL